MVEQLDIGDTVITEEERADLKDVCEYLPSGLILLAAIKVGPNKKRVAKVAQISIKGLEPYWARYKDNGIFTKKFVRFDIGNGSEEQVAIGFTLACAVGDGLMTCEDGDHVSTQG